MKYFHGEITSSQRVLVYEFNITSTESSINSSEPVDINGLCSLINNDQCDCGYTSDCECLCRTTLTTTTISRTPLISLDWCYDIFGSCSCDYTSYWVCLCTTTPTTSRFTTSTNIDWIMEEYWYWYWATHGQVTITTTTTLITTSTVA